jgi:hypothetical protein
MRYRYIVILILIFLVVISTLAVKSIGSEKKTGTIQYWLSQNISDDIKNFIKETIFIIPNQKHIIKSLTKDKEFYIYKLRNLQTKYSNTVNELYSNNINKNLKTVEFFKYYSKNIKFFEDEIVIDIYQANKISNAKHSAAISTGYLEEYKGKILVMSGDGILLFFNKSDLLNSKFVSNKIETNLRQLITDENFYKNSMYGVKDIFVLNDNIFVSYTNKNEEECFNTAILKAKINLEKITFEKFYEPSICIKKSLEKIQEFAPYEVGGRFFSYNDENILFSIGDWRSSEPAQDDSNNLGKIILINLESKKTKIFSKGHRNPQGLFYDSINNLIISTEHGPVGGDEININKYPGEKIINFGWPIASYGEHYGYKSTNSTMIKVMKDKYEKAPLYKSHSKYGFEEPVKFYPTALGIGQIIKIPKKFKEDAKYEYLLATMGGISGNGLGLRHLKFDEEYTNINYSKHFYLKERVRDIIYIDDLNIFLSFFETSGSIATIKNLSTK